MDGPNQHSVEQHERRQLRAEDLTDRRTRERPEDPEIPAVWKQQVADEQGDEGRDQHRHGDDQQIITEERSPVRLGRGSSASAWYLPTNTRVSTNPAPSEPAQSAKQHARRTSRRQPA